MNDIPGIKTEYDFELGENGDFEFTTKITQDNIATLTQNQFDKIHGNNGWAKDRSMRKLASIPVTAVHAAEQQGINLNDKGELRLFLARHPEYMVVKGIDTGRDPHIIVK